MRVQQLTVDVAATAGAARARVLDAVDEVPRDGRRRPPAGVLVLGHGAGGGVDAPDLLAAQLAALRRGWRAVLVEQPWRVAGRRVAPAPARLDEAWLEVLGALRAQGHVPARRPLVVGGRSAGARVACRTAAPAGADGVLALAFPLHPPGRPERSRAEELAGVQVPVLVVQGRRDAFGTGDEVRAALRDGASGHTVLDIDGDHGLAAGRRAVGAAVGGWLASLPR